MTVVAAGSLAFDYIFAFRGRFGEHILPDKTHILNVSFLVDSMEKRRGGVATNYAYSLALLGTPTSILGALGSDGAEFQSWLESCGIDCSGLRVLPDEQTTTGFTITDADDNQITGYYAGAMSKSDMLGLRDTVPEPEAVIVGPNNPAAMLRLVRECRAARVRWVFDPSHQLPQLSGAELEEGSKGAWILIGNDYELEVLKQRTGRSLEQLGDLAELVVTTFGRQGSEIRSREGSIRVPAARAAREVDPVGAGDAYRAGLVHALLRGVGVGDAARVASVAASFVVEQTGTVEHHYTHEQFARRYEESYGEAPPAVVL